MYNIEAAEFEIKRLQDANAVHRAEKAELIKALKIISEMDEDSDIWAAVQTAYNALGQDSSGRYPEFKSGDRVVFLPEKTLGTVEKQILHYDCNETFWGNLIVNMDNGTRLHCNCWQTRKLESPVLDSNDSPIPPVLGDQDKDLNDCRGISAPGTW